MNAQAGYASVEGQKNSQSTVEVRQKAIDEALKKVGNVQQEKTVYIFNNVEYDTKSKAEAARQAKIKELATQLAA